MTQTSTVARSRVAPATAPPSAPQTPDPARAAQPARQGVIARSFAGTRGRLRVLAIVAVVASLAFAVVGAMAFTDRRAALADARVEADQLVRVQGIQNDLARADALATNAFLAQRTGVPPADVVRQYEEAISDASRHLADAARAQPADGPALARVNDQLTDYTARIASAWAVKQDPATPTLATGYLGLASQTLLREGMLPTLDGVVAADAGRVDDAFRASRNAMLELIAAGVVVVVILVVVGGRLAVRFKRYVNVPLAVAAGLVAVFTILGALVLVTGQSRVDQVRDTSYAATRALADARSSAYRAKADESITLIRQNFTLTSSGYEDPAKQAIQRVDQQLQKARDAGVTLDPADPLAPWAAVHKTVIGLVNDGDVAKAVSLVTGSVDTKGTSNNAFRTFETTTSDQLDQASSAVDNDLTSGSWLLVVLAVLALLVGVAAAAASWFGLSQRLEEYR